MRLDSEPPAPVRLAPGARPPAAAPRRRLALGIGPPPSARVEDPPAAEDRELAVSIVIPTKNRPDHLLEAVRRVLAEPGPEREVIVVDSSDGEETQERLARDYPSVRRVRVRGYPHNRHFAKNQGIRLARGRVLCFLDDDSFVVEGWLERLLRHYDDPKVGAAGGRIIDEVFAAGPVGERVGEIEPNGRLHLNFTRDTGRKVTVHHLIGCNLSFRAAALAETGGYDLAYGGPNFMEETDLCLRVGARGWRIVFDPEAVVEHRNAPRDGGLDRRDPLDPILQLWSARSRAYFALKLLPRSVAVLRHNALGPLKQLGQEALRLRDPRFLLAAWRQVLGLVLGAVDWLRAGRPRAPLRFELR